MKLWFDEDLSPTFVQVANELGFEATCNRDRGMLGSADSPLRARVVADGFVFVTDNAADFRPMYARDEISPGLIVMPGGAGRARQQELARRVVHWIVEAARRADETAADFMVNTLVEIDDGGSTMRRELSSI